ncbi:MAG: CRISPR-associated protein Cas4 [Actinobacteria bacterium]|nr:CRISPR-associated protein Cas4 [Actinomycetota bacterium]
MLSNKNYEIDDLVFLSALNHYLYCPRRCALIHIEQLWSENIYTAEGRIMHNKVDTADHESRGNIRIEYAVPLRSLKLGLVGKADVIELHRTDEGTWMPFPVEHKRGKPKSDDCDKVQLCAQAICLEEMMNIDIKNGALFYGRTRRRCDVVFDDALWTETENIAKQVHELIVSGVTPRADSSAKCKNCSMAAICLPKASKRVGSYLTTITREE